MPSKEGVTYIWHDSAIFSTKGIKWRCSKKTLPKNGQIIALRNDAPNWLTVEGTEVNLSASMLVVELGFKYMSVIQAGHQHYLPIKHFHYYLMDDWPCPMEVEHG